MTAQMWRHCGCTRAILWISAWQIWVQPAAEEKEDEHLDRKGNNVGLHVAPEASLLLLLYTWRSLERGINYSQLPPCYFRCGKREWLKLSRKLVFIMDQSVAIQEALDREENCIIVSFLRALVCGLSARIICFKLSWTNTTRLKKCQSPVKRERPVNVKALPHDWHLFK